MKIKKYLQQLKMVAAAGIILLVASCGEEIPPGTTPLKPSAVVKAATSIAEIVQQPKIYEASGTIQPRTAATVSAKVMGEILQVLVQEGDKVKAGDILVKIDDSQISARRRQAKAALAEANQGVKAAQAAFESAQASSKLAEKTFRRYELLLENESVSVQEFDEMKSRYDQATAGLSQTKSMRDAAQNRIAQAKAALFVVKTAFDDTTVIAPYDATVTAKLKDKGDLASPGIPLIRLEETGFFEVQMVLPESHIHQVNTGDQLSVRIPSFQNEALTGKIKTINQTADPGIRSFQVKVSLPDLPGIRAGMYARVLVPIGETGMILVPEIAVVRHGQLSGIFIVDADSIAHFRLIRPGRMFGDHMEVLSGLKAGDRYVTKPNHTIVDGVKVVDQ
ncbi:MAG: efflux RND transporter periplasmic adaptor subunit [Desulfobacteraceae bacterium]|nr:efflux RND transporter periplasmic adaptor subunit [Desulfobacteraceae bacterium]